MFRISAQTDFANKKILPPTYTISYDKINDTPDRDLFQYISSRKNISEWEAMKLVNDFSQELKQHLRSGSELEWRGVGLLKPDSRGDILFEPERLRYDFIPHVDAKRVIRVDADHRMLVGDHEVSKAEMEHYLHEENLILKNRGHWWIYAVIIAALALILIFFKIYTSASTFNGGRMEKVNSEQTPSTYQSSQ